MKIAPAVCPNVISSAQQLRRSAILTIFGPVRAMGVHRDGGRRPRQAAPAQARPGAGCAHAEEGA